MTMPGFLATRPRRYTYLLLTTIISALGAVGCEYASTHQVTEAAEALGAVVLAALIATLAISLPGITLRGLVIGGFFVGAGILSWSYSDNPIVVWSLLLAEGAVFAWWSQPWLRNLRISLRLGGAWLGVSYWILGVVGAALVWHTGVAAGRIMYAGVFGLAVLAVLASTRRSERDDAPRDLSIGVAAAFLLAIAALTVSGSGNLLDTHHVVVEGAWGEKMDYRFWGGQWLLYHPNSLAGIGVAAAIRVGVDQRFAIWQRLSATVLAGGVVFVTNSRTGFVFLGAAGAVHLLLLWWRRRHLVQNLPEYTGRSALVAAATPFVVLAFIFVFSGGTEGFLLKSRYSGGGGDMTSGRTATWGQVIDDWRDASIAEKIFGDAHDIRATVVRESSGTDVKLTTDNAAVGALRRGGVAGVVLSFCLGLGLLLRNAFRKQTSAWFLVAALAALPTIATADWLLGGTGGTLWILLVAGEALALRQQPTIVLSEPDSLSPRSSTGLADRR